MFCPGECQFYTHQDSMVQYEDAVCNIWCKQTIDEHVYGDEWLALSDPLAQTFSVSHRGRNRQWNGIRGHRAWAASEKHQKCLLALVGACQYESDCGTCHKCTSTGKWFQVMVNYVETSRDLTLVTACQYLCTCGRFHNPTHICKHSPVSKHLHVLLIRASKTRGLYHLSCYEVWALLLSRE